MNIALIALRPVRLFGETIAADTRFEASVGTCCRLVRAGRAKLADQADVALLIDHEQNAPAKRRFNRSVSRRVALRGPTQWHEL